MSKVRYFINVSRLGASCFTYRLITSFSRKLIGSNPLLKKSSHPHKRLDFDAVNYSSRYVCVRVDSCRGLSSFDAQLVPKILDFGI